MYRLWSAQNLPQYELADEKEVTKKSENDSPVPMDIGWCFDSVRSYHYFVVHLYM